VVTTFWRNLVSHPEYGGNTFLQNVINHLQGHTVSQLRRPQSKDHLKDPGADGRILK
jgi:hypothetical protein